LEDYASESEQIEQIRKWMKENGPSMLAGVLLAAAGIFGWGQWQHWQSSKLSNANIRYAQVIDALGKNDRAGAAKLADALRSDFARTAYADQADLAVARSLVEAEDLKGADARLATVVRETRDDALKLLARYRLARVQRAEGKADEAIKTLDAGPAAGFEAAFAELRGDIAADKGDSAQALKHYLAAAAGIADGLVNREALELKVTALGGTLPEPAPAAGVRP